MKKRISTLFLLLVLALPTMAQFDYLEPVKGFSNDKGELGSYYRNVFSLLSKEFTPCPYARFSVLPSFAPEYAISIEARKGKEYLLSNTLSQSCWQAEKEKIKVITRTVAIGKPLYQSLGQLIQLVTSQIQDLDGSNSGFDGCTYYFAAADKAGKISMGKTWTPERETRMERLVQICESAYLLSVGKSISEAAIVHEAEALIKELRLRAKSYPDEYKQPHYAGIFVLGTQPSSNGVQTPIEQAPTFPATTPEAYATAHLTYPPTLLSKGVKGYVLCQFTLSKEGRVVNPRILTYSHREFADEALRLVKAMPQWNPATTEGKPVECSYTLYIPFRPQAYKKR